RVADLEHVAALLAADDLAAAERPVIRLVAHHELVPAGGVPLLAAVLHLPHLGLAGVHAADLHPAVAVDHLQAGGDGHPVPVGRGLDVDLGAVGEDEAGVPLEVPLAPVALDDVRVALDDGALPVRAGDLPLGVAAGLDGVAAGRVDLPVAAGL